MDQTEYQTAVWHMVEAARLARERRADLLQRLSGCFTRREPAAQAGKYIDSLAADLPRKNGWTLAEHAGDATPDKMQRLLNHAVWDHRQAMGVAREFVIAHLAGSDAVLVLDESGQEKSGDDTAGVKRQYVGCAGKITNAVNVVYATYATARGHAIVATRLYLPVEWADDEHRRARAGIPDEVDFATKPQLAVQILTELHTAGRLPVWITGDEVYCATRRLVVSPAQPGGTRREVSGSDGLPGTERIRGQEHARKATVVFRRRSDALRDPRDMAKAGLPEP